MKRAVLLLAIAAGLAGCNLTQLAAFRAQMGAAAEYTAWEGVDEGVLVFKQPLLTLDDLAGVHVHPEILSERVAVLRYRRANVPAGLSVDTEIRLLFETGKLAGLVFPPSLRDGLGRENIVRLLAMAGGGTGTDGGGMRQLPKAQLISAGLFPKTRAPLGHEVEILLMPADDRNRPIYIKMTETKNPDCYSDFLISFKRR